LADFANRRKELKFAATDLKLFRRQQETRIEHWGVWREKAPPKTYFLWAARLKSKSEGRQDDIARLASEAQALVNTYLEGAGVIAWQAKADGTGYDWVPLPASAHVSTLDDVLYRVASEINDSVKSEGGPPAPILPDSTAVDFGALTDDVQID
jgi:hypothetical protein